MTGGDSTLMEAAGRAEKQSPDPQLFPACAVVDGYQGRRLLVYNTS
jgi:hypothetical protein